MIESKTIDGARTGQFEIDFSLTNKSENNINNLRAEMKAPSKFEIKTKPILVQTLEPEETIREKFIAQLPPRAKGEQTIVLSYDFSDSNGPHYFEKNFKITIQNQNYDLLWIIGIIILFSAAYLFIKKEKEENTKSAKSKN